MILSDLFPWLKGTAIGADHQVGLTNCSDDEIEALTCRPDCGTVALGDTNKGATMWGKDNVDFGTLKGKTLTNIVGGVGDESMTFETTDGEKYKLLHDQD